MKPKLKVTRFGGTLGKLSFDERSFSILCWVLHRFGTINLLMQSMLIAWVYIIVMRFYIYVQKIKFI